MLPTVAQISVIIVNYNAADLVIDSIHSVLTHTHGGRYVDVHVVDNASPEGDGVILATAIADRGWGDRVTLYAETTNHGFGRGNNLVLERLAQRKQPPQMVFLLNPDARLENEAMEILADFIDTHLQIGAAGARIKKPGGIPVTGAFRFPTLISEFAKGVSFGPINRFLARWETSFKADILSSQVDWVAGAAVMFRFSTLRDTGFFDPDYFLYYEEVDLMKRLTKNGQQIWYVAEAHVIHVEGASTGVKSGEDIPKRRPAYWYESWRFYYLKNHGRVYALAAGAMWVLGSLMNRSISFLRRRQPATAHNFISDFWAVGLRPLLGLKARPYEL